MQRLSKEALEAVGQFIPSGVVVIEKEDDKVVYVNQRAVELFGFNPSGLSFKQFAINMAKARKLEDGPYLYEQLPLIKALLYGKTTRNQEVTFQRPNQTQITVLANATPLTDQEGNITGALATFEDITEGKKTAKTLHECELELRLALEGADAGMWIRDQDGSWKGTPQLNALFGLSPTEPSLKESEFSAFIHPEDLPIVEKAWSNAIENKSYDQEYRIVWRDGSVHWLASKGKVISKDGQPRFIGVSFDITERKNAEEALRQSEDRMRAIAESSNVEISVSSLDGTMLFVNDAYAQTFGYSKEELIGYHTPNLYVNPKDREQLIATLKKQGYVKNFETLVKRKDGTTFWIAASISVIHYGKQQAVIGVSIDITKRKQAEEAIKESERLYRTLFDSTEDGFILAKLICDQNGNPYDSTILRGNQALKRQTRLDAAEVVGKRLVEVLPSLTPNWLFTFDIVAKTGKSVRFDNYNPATKQWYDVYAFPYREGQIGLLFRNITPRKSTEESLKQNEAKYRELFSSMNEMFQVLELIYDKSGKAVDYYYREVNPAFERLVGRSREELIGKRAKDLFTIEDYWIKAYSKVDKTGKPAHYENYGAEMDRYYEVYIWKVRQSQNQVAAIFADVTERKCLEKQLQEKQRMAAIGETAGMVGHDLRNPLQTISGEVYLANDELAVLPESEHKHGLQESVKVIAEQVSYMDKIVGDLQTFVRPVEVSKQEVSLKPFIEGFLGQIKITANIQTSTQIPDNLTVNTDPQLLRRVLTNLVTNAIQAMPEGGELTTMAQANDGQVQITVQDTGVGISDEIKEKIFTPLFTTKSKGQGFGLAVCKRVIEAQGGAITFESEKGKGTKFVVSLPTQKS